MVSTVSTMGRFMMDPDSSLFRFATSQKLVDVDNGIQIVEGSIYISMSSCRALS